MLFRERITSVYSVPYYTRVIRKEKKKKERNRENEKIVSTILFIYFFFSTFLTFSSGRNNKSRTIYISLSRLFLLNGMFLLKMARRIRRFWATYSTYFSYNKTYLYWGVAMHQQSTTLRCSVIGERF